MRRHDTHDSALAQDAEPPRKSATQPVIVRTSYRPGSDGRPVVRCIALLLVFSVLGGSLSWWKPRSAHALDIADANGASSSPSISAAGLVAFASRATNLVAGDTNGASDIFVRHPNGVTARLSVNSDEQQATRNPCQICVVPDSDEPKISRDGRYVAFGSWAENLTPNDTNYSKDVFVRDLLNGTTTAVSVSGSGALGNSNSLYGLSISGDGRYVAFTSAASNLVPGDTNNAYDIFVRDLIARTTTRVSVGASSVEANHLSTWPTISSDGRYVAFLSLASNLVTGDTNTSYDVFVRDLAAGTTSLVSLSALNVQAPSVSPYDYPAISDNANYIAFTSRSSLHIDDTNGLDDVYIRDRGGNTTILASRNATGGPSGYSSRPSISADGRYTAFQSSSPLVGTTYDSNGASDIYEYDRLAPGTMTLMSEEDNPTGGKTRGNAPSYTPAISSDGSQIAFASAAAFTSVGTTAVWPGVWLHLRRDRCILILMSVTAAGILAGTTINTLTGRTGGALEHRMTVQLQRSRSGATLNTYSIPITGIPPTTEVTRLQVREALSRLFYTTPISAPWYPWTKNQPQFFNAVKAISDWMNGIIGGYCVIGDVRRETWIIEGDEYRIDLVNNSGPCNLSQ